MVDCGTRCWAAWPNLEVCLAWSKSWTRWFLKVPSNLNYSLILWFTLKQLTTSGSISVSDNNLQLPWILRKLQIRQYSQTIYQNQDLEAIQVLGLIFLTGHRMLYESTRNYLKNKNNCPDSVVLEQELISSSLVFQRWRILSVSLLLFLMDPGLCCAQLNVSRCCCFCAPRCVGDFAISFCGL